MMRYAKISPEGDYMPPPPANAKAAYATMVYVRATIVEDAGWVLARATTIAVRHLFPTYVLTSNCMLMQHVHILDQLKHATAAWQAHSIACTVTDTYHLLLLYCSAAHRCCMQPSCEDDVLLTITHTPAWHSCCTTPGSCTPCNWSYHCR